MALVVYDRIQQTGTANTTVSFTLSATTTGYQSFAVVGNGNTTYYSANDGTNWEVGLGTYSTTGPTLTRTTILSSSNSGAAVTFTGTVTVFCDYPAGKAVIQDSLGTATVPQIATNSYTSTTPVLSFNASNSPFASGASVSSSYLQTVLQNKSGTAGASTNYVLSNDLGTDSTYYGEFGMNSSVYSASTPSDFFSINNGVYFSGHDGDITVGSGNGYKTYLAWGTTGDKAHVINASGALGLNTNITGTTNFGTSGQVLTSAGSSATPTWSSTISPSQVLINQSYDQGTGVLQVTGQSTFNGAVTDKSLNLQGGNNLQPYSNDFTNTSGWGRGTNVSITANTTTDPFGGSTASTLSKASGTYSTSGLFNTSQNLNTNTQSIYAKANTFNYLALSTAGGSTQWAWFNLSNGTIPFVNGTSVTASIVAVGNGWYRCTMSVPSTNSEFFLISVKQTAVNVEPWSTAETTTGGSIYIWGAQLELGSVASAYTPTTTTAITTTNNISVPSGQVLGALGSSSAVTYAVNSTNNGMFGTSNALYWSVYGTTNMSLLNGQLGIPNILSFGTSGDTFLTRDAANILAQRNSTNAQTFRLYNTYTDASNYERLSIDWSTTANTATIVTQNAGTGSARNLAIGQDLYVNGVRVGLGGGSVADNTATGNQAINATATGGGNSAFGKQALRSVTSGIGNTSLGFQTLLNTTSGNHNVAVGNLYGLEGVLQSNTTGSYNIGVGGASLAKNTTASNLVAIGTQSLYSNTTNVATLGTITGGSSYTNGTYTGVVMTLSSGSSAITYPTATIVVAGGVVTTVTLTSNGVGFKDTTTVLTAPAASIGGTGSGFSVPVATLASGTGNVAVGFQAGYSNTTGTNNTFTGYLSGYSNTTGTNNSFAGYQAGNANTTGTQISAFGFNAFANGTGSSNSSFGAYALSSACTGLSNSAFGRYAMQANTSGASNSSLGATSLLSNTTGSYNIAFGYAAGYGNASANANTTGSNNTYLGYQTVGSANNNTNEMVIGYNAVGLGSNTTVIGNSSTTLTKAFGVIVGTNYTVATLPSASTSGVGARAFVTDALAPVFGSAVAGSGAVPVPVYSTGSAWNVG